MTKKKSTSSAPKSAIISKKAIRTWWLGFIIVLALTIVAEIFFPNSHGHFTFDEYISFHAIFGFIACVAIVFVSKFLGIFLKRKENYYQEDSSC